MQWSNDQTSLRRGPQDGVTRLQRPIRNQRHTHSIADPREGLTKRERHLGYCGLQLDSVMQDEHLETIIL